MDKVILKLEGRNTVTVKPAGSDLVVIKEQPRTRITVRDAGSQGIQGLKGDAGQDGVVPDDVVTIVQNLIGTLIHADASDDGISIDNNGNIRLAIGELQSLP